ncbi:MAG: hypothetical protein AVDCRST_MAG27-543, partial [uncultured Craurococcus sp.]
PSPRRSMPSPPIPPAAPRWAAPAAGRSSSAGTGASSPTASAPWWKRLP